MPPLQNIIEGKKRITKQWLAKESRNNDLVSVTVNRNALTILSQTGGGTPCIH